jgi:tetratricopeptide (TPR) repeat protein/TolB-like protein
MAGNVPGRDAKRQRSRTASAAVAALVFVALAAGVACRRPAHAPPNDAAADPDGHTAAPKPVAARRAIAVLGFKNLSGRPAVAWVSTALSEMLTTELSVSAQLRTVPAEIVSGMRSDFALGDAESLTPEALATIRSHVGSDLVVLGSYGPAGTAIQFDVRMQDARTGATVLSFADMGTEEELLDVVSRMGRRLRDQLGAGALSADEAATLDAVRPANPVAARLYAEGLASLRMSDAASATRLLEKAAAADPENAMAHSALAAAWSALGYEARAADAVTKAVALSADLSREHRLVVEAQKAQADREWDSAIRTFTLLWSLFPDNDDYGLQLARAQVSGGRAKDSLETVALLRKRSPQIAASPRADIAEAEAAASLSDFRRQQAAAATAVAKGTALGAPLLVAQARLLDGQALLSLGEPSKAMAAYEEADRIYGEAGDRRGAARALQSRAIVLRQQGDLPQARAMYTKALAVYRDIGDQRDIVTVTSNLANVLRQQGDLAGANARYQEALAAARRIGDRRSEAQVLHSTAIVLRQQGDAAGAKARYREALAIRRELGVKNGIASTLNNLANVLYDEGDLAGAKAMYEESLQISRQIGEQSGIALALANVAGVLADRGNLAEAATMYEESLAIRRAVGGKSTIASSLTTLAHLLQDQGKLRQAREAAVEALALYRELGETRGVGSVQYRLGDISATQGDLGAARKAHEEALRIRQKLAEVGTVADSRLALARLSLQEGNAKSAEAAARQSVDTFAAQKYIDDEAMARAVWAQSLVALARPKDAREAIAQAMALANRSQSRLPRFEVEIARALVDAASGRQAVARAALQTIRADAAQMGFLGYAFAARLAIGEIDAERGDARESLASLARDAEAAGYGWIARRAARAGQTRPEINSAAGPRPRPAHTRPPS